MKILIFTFCLLWAGTARSQDFKVISHTDHAEVINVKYGYRFQAPLHWYLSATNPVPYAFSYPPRQMRLAQAGVPPNGADLAIVADKDSHNLQSIDKWMQIDRETWGFSSVNDLDAKLNPLITRAVEVVAYHDDGDKDREQVTQISSVYFEFDGHIFLATLRFNANDPKARQYERCLYDVLRSFQKAVCN